MISLLLELVLVVGLSVLAHGIIAYVIAPRRAKQSILDAISTDVTFQDTLIHSLVTSSSRPMQWTDASGQPFTKSPIELLSSIISNKFQADFKSYIGGKQSEMIRDMESNAQTSMQMMPDNPLVGLALAQLPKKYWPILQILVNLLNQQKPS